MKFPLKGSILIHRVRASDLQIYSFNEGTAGTTVKVARPPATLQGYTMTNSSKQQHLQNRIINTNLQMSKIFKILISILRYISVLSKEEEIAISLFFAKITKIWKACGISFTIRYMKSLRLHVTRFMAGQPLSLPGNVEVKISLDSDHFPKILSPLKH